MLLWFLLSFSFLVLTAVSAVPLRFLLTRADVVLVALTVSHFAEGQLGVKIILLRNGWLMAVNTWLYGGSNASKRDLCASITYEILGIGGSFSGEDFQNKGTFIVVRSSVFVKSSGHNTHLARDA